MITIAAGFVGSCAADMLALGDYAIAYPFSVIHYHGTRQQDNEITLQKIPNLAATLRATNEQFAYRLAPRMFRRMVFHIAKSNQLQKPEIGPQEMFDVKEIISFTGFLKGKLSKQAKLVENTEAKQAKFSEMVTSLTNANVALNDHAALFKHLLDMEMRSKPKALLTSILPMVEEDFVQVCDFVAGRYQQNLLGIIESSGVFFLAPQEHVALEEARKEGPEAYRSLLTKTLANRLEPLWFFVVSLCRALQEGEYPLSPVEAYWAGLVDEVIGLELPCVRSEIESLDFDLNAPVPPPAAAPT